MSVKSDKVKSGYSELSETERAEVRAFIEVFERSGPITRISLSERSRETFNKSLGPISGNNCPCCGK